MIEDNEGAVGADRRFHFEKVDTIQQFSICKYILWHHRHQLMMILMLQPHM
jgi:hypothetical protein